MKDLLFRSVKAALGLVFFGFGVFLTIQADIGLAPWDCLNVGIAGKLNVSYGTISVLLSVLIVLIDLLLGERIGLGTILDALLVGPSVDMFATLGIVPKSDGSLWMGLILLSIGLFIMAFGQFFYMSARLCCGPRDSLLVGLGKRLRRWPIGAVNVVLQLTVLITGALLGGPVGVGTVASVFLLGIITQLVFRLVRFEPRDLLHEDIVFSVKSIITGKPAA